MSSEKTLFSKIIDREIPATIRYEDDQFIAIDDIQPIAPIHVLIISKHPYASLEDVPDTDAAFHHNLLLTARKVAKQLNIADNYKLMMNVGKRVQEIHHIHLHLLGGWDNKTNREKLDSLQV